jgi:hypothetical protein
MRLATCLFCLGIATVPASSLADEIPVDLELVLAVDVSSSIGGDEQFLQRQGYVTALQSPEVIAAIRAGPFARIAVAYVEWGDLKTQNLVLPWTLVDDRLSAMSVAYRLSGEPIGRSFGTSIAGALAYSAALFDGNGFRGERRVIDISGNGPNNVAPPVAPAREAVVEEGVTINGLPVMIDLVCCSGLYSIEGLDLYFEDCVIGGPGAFVMPVTRREDFSDIIRRKLLVEIVGPNRDALKRIAFVERQRTPLDCAMIEENPSRILPLTPQRR